MKIIISATLFSLVFLMSACQQSTPQGENGEPLVAATTFGEVDRIDILTKPLEEHPEQYYVARLTNPNGKKCTATIIANDIALTSAHCVSTDSATKNLIPGVYLLELAYNRGIKLAESRVTKIYTGPRAAENTWASIEADWALLRLEKPLGEDHGHFKLSPIKELKHFQVNILGYSAHFNNLEENGRYPTLQEKCMLREWGPSHFFVDCDARKGDSGSPIYYCNKEDCFILGMFTTYLGKVPEMKEYSRDNANVAVRIENFEATLQKMLNNEL